jgi:hypothetical protein
MQGANTRQESLKQAKTMRGPVTDKFADDWMQERLHATILRPAHPNIAA